MSQPMTTQPGECLYRSKPIKDLLVSYDPDLGSGGQLLGLEILEPQGIELKLVARIARRFHVPELAQINPRAIPGIFASA